MVNFFFIDRDPAACARAHGDKHVVKLVVEAATVASSVWHAKVAADPTLAVPPTIYRATHKNHPLTLWAGKSRAHYLALITYGLQLVIEKRRRIANMSTLPKELQRSWSTEHKSAPVLETLRDNPPPLESFPDGDAWSDPPLCMPEFYRTDPATGKQRDVVAAYRLYYAGNKVTGLKWLPYVEEPAWLDACKAEIARDPVLSAGLAAQVADHRAKQVKKAAEKGRKRSRSKGVVADSDEEAPVVVAVKRTRSKATVKKQRKAADSDGDDNDEDDGDSSYHE